jgi:hypothetical protein
MVAGDGDIDDYVDVRPRRLHHPTMIRNGKKVL